MHLKVIYIQKIKYHTLTHTVRNKSLHALKFFRIIIVHVKNFFIFYFKKIKYLKILRFKNDLKKIESNDFYNVNVKNHCIKSLHKIEMNLFDH